MKSADKKRSKQFYRNLIVGNVEKNSEEQAGMSKICHINMNRSQETGNRQSTVTLVRMRAERIYIVGVYIL